MSDFYYSDSYFQLELNLQETRRELIALIEACELKDSAICIETQDSSDNKHEDNKKDQFKVAPGVDLLPKPKWNTTQPLQTDFKYDVQSWLQMGSVHDQLNPENRIVNFRKTPSKSTKSNIESPGKEFCLKFADTYNLNFIMKANNIGNNADGKITVDAFFKSFKDVKPATKPTTPFDITQANISRDYAYF